MSVSQCKDVYRNRIRNFPVMTEEVIREGSLIFTILVSDVAFGPRPCPAVLNTPHQLEFIPSQTRENTLTAIHVSVQKLGHENYTCLLLIVGL